MRAESLIRGRMCGGSAFVLSELYHILEGALVAHMLWGRLTDAQSASGAIRIQLAPL